MNVRYPAVLLACVSLMSSLTTSFTTGDCLSDTYVEARMVKYQLASSTVTRAPSAVSCAAECTRQYRNCSAFLYHSAETACTLGVKISTSGTSLESYLDMYAVRCSSTRGFEITNIDGEIYCLHFSQFKSSYHEAYDFCSALGSRLWKCNSNPKVEYLRQLRNFFWVGLDGIEKQGTFVWSNGDVITTLEKDEVFGPKNYDNIDVDESCFQYHPGIFDSSIGKFGFLAGFSCEEKREFVCEYPVL